MSTAQILLVEDESIVAQDMKHRLQNMGYGVSAVASSGAEALQKAKETPPDLVLMDIVLKGEMDGVEASELLRQRYDVPVIYLTAYADASTLGRAIETEPFGYLLKPFEERELRATVELALFRHRTEKRLKETERRLATTLHSIGDAVIATDARSRVQLLNPAAEILTGWTAAAATGLKLAEVFPVLNEQTLTLPLDQALHAPVMLPEGSVLLSKDDREVPIEGMMTPMVDDDGNFDGMVLVFRDISERLRRAESLAQIQNQLHQAQKMEAVGRLAGGVAHDFNNMLTAILGNLSLFLADPETPATSRGSLEVVEKTALRAADLVRQLLGFARQTKLHLAPVRLHDLISEIIALLRPTVGAGIALRYQPAPDLWTVHADANQIHQVLVNLCMNAKDAMPQGGSIVLETSNVVMADDRLGSGTPIRPGEYVRLRVRDTGHGVPEQLRSRIFEPFFTTKEPGKGTGLGLAMVHGIVEQHHGVIECHSDLQPGTRFDIYLPRYYQEPGEKVEPPEARAPAPEKPRNVGPETVLLADDEQLIRDLGRRILEQQGIHVLLAEDGQQAVEIYRREQSRIDLVILDVTMPHLSGGDAFQKMLAINPEVRVLFSSGYFAEDVPVTEHEHVLGFLGKPYRAGEMLATVTAALQQIRAPLQDPLLVHLTRLESLLAAGDQGSSRVWVEDVRAVLAQVQETLGKIVQPPLETETARPSLQRQAQSVRRAYCELHQQADHLMHQLNKARSTLPANALPSTGDSPSLTPLRHDLQQLAKDLRIQRKEQMDLAQESVTTDIGAGD